MSEILIKQSETINIDLPGKGTSGYAWSYSADNTDILLIIHTYIVPANLQAGSTGIERFALTGIAAGTCALHFSQTRSWEKDLEPIDKREYVVRVVS
jgi:predicted secreted protein